MSSMVIEPMTGSLRLCSNQKAQSQCKSGLLIPTQRVIGGTAPKRGHVRLVVREATSRWHALNICQKSGGITGLRAFDDPKDEFPHHRSLYSYHIEWEFSLIRVWITSWIHCLRCSHTLFQWQLWMVDCWVQDLYGLKPPYSLCS